MLTILDWLADVISSHWAAGGPWRLEGWDTFAREAYPIAGRYRSRRAAEWAAERCRARIEREQPSALSGGAAGIQDRVYVRGPETGG
ncbi:MAG: hypothetical protein GC150_15755 [Rhizobiales bacterium]|nr:hypothetical protein [Hyphomicrobiales bacterium]